MTGRDNILISAVAGAVGGALILLLAFNSPAAARLFSGGQSGSGEVVTTVESEQELRRSYESLVVEAVEKSNPAVVSIVITKDVPVIERFFEDVPAGPFGNFFRVPQFRQNGTQEQEVGGGSGFLISADGMIVTNKHVVDQDDVEYTVFTNDGTSYKAEVVARDPINDLAIIRIEGSGLPFLEFADSDELKVGQSAIAIGNALAQYRNTVSVGVVSGLSRSILAGDRQGQPEQLEEVIQTDAAINPGNSGGPLLNLDGKVIGVNVAVALGSQNIGFALPVNLLRDVVESVERTGRIVRPFLGVRYTMITAAIKEQNDLPVDYGALIVGDSGEEAVVADSAAANAGLQSGDIVLEIDGVRLADGVTLASQIRNKSVGQEIRLKFLREGVEKTATATLIEVPSE